MVAVEQMLKEERTAKMIMLNKELRRRRSPPAPLALTKNPSSLKMSKNQKALPLKLKINQRSGKRPRTSLPKVLMNLNNLTDLLN